MHDDIRTDGTPGVGVRAQADPDGEADAPGSSREDQIGVGSGDENVAKIQLAARWAEKYAAGDDALDDALSRFQRAYMFIDSVTKLVDPAAK